MHLDRKQSSEINLSDGFGHGLVLNAAPLGLDLIQFVGGPHEVKHLVVFQQSVP